MFRQITTWWRKNVQGKRTWDEAVEGCTRVNQVAFRTVQRLFVTNTSENVKSCKSPREIWERGSANAYGFAIVVKELCFRIGIFDAEVIVKGDQAVTTGTLGNERWMVSYGRYSVYPISLDVGEAFKRAIYNVEDYHDGIKRDLAP